MNDQVLKGIRRRLTVLCVLVAAIAITDALFFRSHPGTPEFHRCRVD